jgi:hypothetical protein
MQDGHADSQSVNKSGKAISNIFLEGKAGEGDR